jgi:hypothetical protein
MSIFNNYTKTITFCTSILNRANSYKTIIRDNLELIKFKKNVSLCVLDYGSSDDIYEYIKKNFSYFIKTKKLKFVSVIEKKEKYWHSHAKNIAHIMADSDVISCLDADSRLTDEYINFIYKNIQPNNILCGMPNYGLTGNITLYKNKFLELGGYEEQYYKEIYGNEDSDLVKRARMLKMLTVNVPIYYTRSVHHSDDIRVKFTRNDNRDESLRITRIIFNDMLLQNKIIANVKGIKSETLEVNFERKIFLDKLQ